jgi:hypothetical protein
MKAGLDDRPELIGSDEDELFERATLVRSQQPFGDVAYVHGDLPLNSALVARLGPAALGVTSMQIVPDDREFNESLRPTTE